MSDQDRQEFEAWYARRYWPDPADWADGFADRAWAEHIADRYEAWQAARTPSQAPAPGDAGVVEALESESATMLSNLLARIHRDGGHHEADHGTEPSVRAAVAKVLGWLSRDDAALSAGDAAPQPAGSPGEWTGNVDADAALVMLDRLDVSAEDDARVDEIAAIVRHLAAGGPEISYATRLAESLHAKHYGAITTWKPLPDLLGVLTQIDNMVAGLAAPTAAQPVGEEAWRPIESAPKDETEFLAYKFPVGQFVALILDSEHPDCQYDGGIHEAWSHQLVDDVTHWQPLPPPPTAARAAQAQGDSNA